jgi:hypothetical protein
MKEHYKYSNIRGAVCDKCLEIVHQRGGFDCRNCYEGMCHDVQAIAFYDSPIDLRLHRHKKQHTLFTEKSWIDGELPDGAMRVISEEYALLIPESLICYPSEHFYSTEVREKLIDQAVERLKQFRDEKYINRDRIAKLIFI